MSELREGLAKTLLDGQIVFTHERAAINLIDELVKVIRQHDGHAEFVRRIATLCEDNQAPAIVRVVEIAAMCRAELAKDQP